MSSTTTTTFKDLSDQAMTLIALVSEKIEAVRAASRTASKKEVGEMISHLMTINDLMTRMDELKDGPDQERVLMAVLRPATEVNLEVEGMFLDVWGP